MIEAETDAILARDILWDGVTDHSYDLIREAVEDHCLDVWARLPSRKQFSHESPQRLQATLTRRPGEKSYRGPARQRA